MADSSSYDIIIAGAGASGLSLVWYLLQSASMNEKKILLLDISLEPTDDKTWCFWEDSDLPSKNLIYHSWNTLQVRAFDNILTETLSRYRYQCVRSQDYSESILNMAFDHPNITCLETVIQHFDSDNEQGIVHTENGSFTAEWIFQSVLKPKSFHKQQVDISLKQHFMGWEIETNKPVFDPDKVMLMDFDTSQKQGVTFFYILPFSETRALVEYTFFTSDLLSEKEYEDGIRSYLKERFNLVERCYNITRTEFGSVPMEDRRYSAWYTSRIMNIGTVGGLTKPSTGYTFTRIHKHCRRISEALEQGKKPPVFKPSGYRFRVYDMMILYLLKSEPDLCKTIFHDLFKKNRFDRILQFLEEDTHPGQEISIFSTLPYLPFFKAIYKMKHRIFTGS